MPAQKVCFFESTDGAPGPGCDDINWLHSEGPWVYKGARMPIREIKTEILVERRGKIKWCEFWLQTITTSFAGD